MMNFLADPEGMKVMFSRASFTCATCGLATDSRAIVEQLGVDIAAVDGNERQF